MKPISAGDTCIVVESIDGHAVGRKVRVISLQGQHSKLGNIWRCKSLDGQLVSEYGAVGETMDFAASWLLKTDPVETNTKQTEKELSNDY
jgi:hypothetical protein